MKLSSGLIAAACWIAVAAYGCGEGSEPDMTTISQQQASGQGGLGGQGGIGAQGGTGATGSTWAPVVGGFGGMGAGSSGGVISGAGGAAGVGAPVTGGMGAAGMGSGFGGMGAGMDMETGGMGAAGMGGPTSVGDPVIPEVMGECPSFGSSVISVMGLGGIAVEAGPKAAGQTAPLVFYWHGTGGSAGEYAFQAGPIAQAVVAEGGVLVSFDGTTGGDLLSGTFIFGASDFAVADQIVACAVRDHNVDPHRIYATGCSAGGLFSAAMAAERSNYVAAVAPNSGGWTVPVGFQNDYTPALMTIHGAPGVDVVLIDFSDSSATADAAFKARGGFVINCNHGGTHCGGGGLAPDVWQFFEAHPYGVDPYPWTSLPAGFDPSCKIY